MPDTLTIFYSWQSNLRRNRNFLNTALEKALKTLNKDDPSRHLELDEGARNTPGAQNIAETILRKIDRAAVFVADVTLVASTPDYIPNPNVMLETGYALARLGPHRVITVVNEAYGDVEQLPFDLSYRHALTYTWSEEEDPAEVRTEVVGKLVGAIREALPVAVPPVGPSEQQLPEPVFRGTQVDWMFPPIQLAAADQAWVEILAEAFEAGRREPDHVFVRDHRRRLGVGFNPALVDRRVVTNEGRDITPLGLWHVNPETPWLMRADVVFRYVKQLLAHDHRLTILSVATIAKKLGLTPRDVSHSLHLLKATHGWACSGMAHAPNSEGTHPQLSSSFQVTNERVFRFYERFATLAQTINGTLLAPNPPREF
jgi:nucleoside 2-deoxyribosyltransferase